MSEPLRVLLLGATGLVGQHILAQAVGRTDFRLLALSRREVPMPKGARMEVLLAPTENWDQAIQTIAPDRVICALGTTIRKMDGDEAKFVAVDRDLVVTAAKACKAAGASGLVVISSVGADRYSKNLYLRTKGEMETEVAKCGLRQVDILRPGLLRGKRDQDPRGLEALGKLVAPIADLFLQGERRKYRSIKAEQVARAALQFALISAPGKFVHEHDEILRQESRWHRR
jgi:uncharacterized protein YbjT (DUF2867 family)